MALYAAHIVSQKGEKYCINNTFGLLFCNSCFYRELEVLKGGLLAKSRKLFFQGRSFLEGKIQKIISKNFIVSNRLLGHTDYLYTYKGHIEHVGFT